MGTIQVPGNPFAGSVTPNATNGLGKLHEMPKTKYGKYQLLSGLAEDMAGAVDKWQKETDAAIVQDAVNQTKNELEDLKTNQKDGWANQLGGNAVNRPEGQSLTEEYSNRGKKVFENRRSQLHTLRQKQMYDAYAQAAGQKLTSDLQAHTVKQQAVFEKATHAATFNSAVQDILSGDGEKMQSGYTVAMTELQWQADRSGLPVDVHGTVGKVNVMAIEGFIDGKNPEGASRWLEAHRDDMSEAQQKKAEALIKAGRQARDVDYLTATVWADPEASDGDVLKKLEAATKNQPAEVRQKVTIGVRRLMADREWKRRVEANDLYDTGVKMIANGERLEATQLSRLYELNPEKAAKLEDAQTSRDLTNLTRDGVLDYISSARTKAGKALGVKVLQERESDPVGTALATGQYGVQPLDWQNTDNLREGLRKRMEASETIAKDWGTPRRVFTKAEATQLTSVLDSMEIEPRVALLSTIADSVGSEGIAMIADQLGKDGGKYAIAMAGFDTTPGDGGMTAGEMYLRGLQKLSEKVVKEDSMAETGVKARLYNAIEEGADGTGGLLSSQKARDATVELARGIYAYKSWQGRVNIDDVVAAAVGGRVEKHNGKKIVMPRDVEESSLWKEDLGNLVERQADTLRSGRGRTFYAGGLAFTSKELAARLPKLKLQTEKVNSDGSVTYSVLYNGEIVADDTGATYTFELSKSKD